MADSLLDRIAYELGSEISAVARVHGGDVAMSYRLDLADERRVFAKTHATPPPNHFSTEAAGLVWIGDSNAIDVPNVLAVSDDPPFLVLEWIEEGAAEPDTEASLGRSLAALHQSGAPCFGREDRRSTGSRGIPNEPCSSWIEFYATQRLQPLARLAQDGGALPHQTLRQLAGVAGRLEELGGDPEPPARLHGDLWAGNRLVGAGGRNWLIDPAAHSSHREFDLAMMRLFGGFGPECFSAYQEAFPLQEGWRDRVPLHQLAPLVVHAIKFGGSYPAAVAEALSRYQ